MKISLGLAAKAAAASLAVSAVASAPVFPVKALALPEFTTSARAMPPPSLARHHSTGADGHFEVVNTPATCVPSSNKREQHVGAALVADAGGAGGEADPLDGRDDGNRRGGERRDG